MSEVISNTGPLIALASIGQFDLLHKLFGTLHIPTAVRSEILDQNTLALKSKFNEFLAQLPYLPRAVALAWPTFPAASAQRRARGMTAICPC